MKIGVLTGIQSLREFGYGKQMEATYLVEVPYADVEGMSQNLIHAIVASQREFEAFESLRITLREESATGYVFHVQGTLLQTAQSQKNFVYRYNSGLVNEQKGMDVNGYLNTVQYPAYSETGEITVALTDVPTPTFELIATGVRDLGRYASPETDPVLLFQYIWHNKVNSEYWRGIPARYALCTGVFCDPLYLRGEQYVYTITFHFSVKTQDTHDPWIYYTDANGKVPGDAYYQIGGMEDYYASYRKSRQYYEIDYNLQYPLGSDV